MEHPVFIAIISNHCIFCPPFMKEWPTLVQKLLEIYPQLSFPKPNQYTKEYVLPPIKVIDNNLNSYEYPKDLLNYARLWTPMIMLVPGKVWSRCCAKLGPNNPEKLEALEVMNSKWINNQLTFYPVYPKQDVQHVVIWFKEALQRLIRPSIPILQPLPAIPSLNLITKRKLHVLPSLLAL